MKQKLLNILKSTGVLILMLLWPSVIFIIFNVDINNILYYIKFNIKYNINYNI